MSNLEHRLVGSLIITSHKTARCNILRYAKYGRIVFCENLPNQEAGWCVRTNRIATLQKLFKRLGDKKNGDIGFIFIRNVGQSKTTYETFQAYQAVYHQKIPVQSIAYAKTFQDGQMAFQKLQHQLPNLRVLLTESDATAAGAYEMDKHHQVQIIGQGNTLLSRVLGFSSIDQHLNLIGKKAVELTLDKGKIQQPIVKFNIVYR